MPKTLSIDLETFSPVDIRDCGSFRYIDDPEFEILLFGYAFGEDEPTVVDLCSGEAIPDEVTDALYSSDYIKTGYNNAFERYALWKHFGRYCPPEQWEDTMVLAAVCGLPLGLGAVGSALGLPEDKAKDKAGKALIKYFCCPCKPTKTNGGRERNYPEHAPEKWAQFIEYNRQDIVTERHIRNMLLRWKPDETEHRFWCLDARINERGMRVDTQLVRNALDFDARYKAELTEKAVTLSGLDNPKSVAQIKDWLYQQEGITVASLNKAVVADVIKQLNTDKAREFMAVRAELSKTSTMKYEAMRRSVCPDGHIKGCFQFYGASRTGRFAGRLVQLQNLPQNHMEDLATARALVSAGQYETVKALYESVSGTLSELIRTALIPEPGCRFIVCDYSAIEARVIAWLADEQWRLDVFRSGGDIYCASASQMFKVPVVKHGENGHLRQKGKIAELALGYGGGVNALKAFGADKMGMSDEDMVETVDLWRSASPHICALWKSLERAMIKCIVRKCSTVSTIGHIRFDWEQGIVWMRLPSGRRIAYYGAQYGESRWKNGNAISYMGQDQRTKKWARLETWGGKLVENCWAEGTLVLTDRGWVPIESITPADLIWDGIEWVETDGAIRREHREQLFELDGLLVTGDHRILTTEGWRNVKTCDGLDRLPVQLPENNWPRQEQGRPRQNTLGGEMRMRETVGSGYPGHTKKRKTRPPLLLRMQETRAHVTSTYHARNVSAPRLCRLALFSSALYKPKRSGLAQLWGAGYYRLRQMAAQLRELLGGHGRFIQTTRGLGVRPHRQRHGIFTGQLPLGVSIGQRPKQTRRPQGAIQRALYPAERTVGNNGYRVHNTVVSFRPRLSVRTSDRHSGPDKPIYDILNCGARHRYVVLGNTGAILSHNCVQSIARDCLRESMLALDAAGCDIRAHVHDEVIISEPRDGRSVEDIAEIMGRPLPWAEGLPLRGDGYECDFYMKD